MYVLDTDHITIFHHESQPDLGNIERRVAATNNENIFVTIVSFHEQMLGANAYISKARRSAGVVHGYRLIGKLLASYERLQVLPFDDRAAEILEEISPQKLRVSTMDARIASIALAHDFTVVTRNTVDFERIPNLKIEDWTVA